MPCRVLVDRRSTRVSMGIHSRPLDSHLLCCFLRLIFQNYVWDRNSMLVYCVHSTSLQMSMAIGNCFSSIVIGTLRLFPSNTPCCRSRNRTTSISRHREPRLSNASPLAPDTTISFRVKKCKRKRAQTAYSMLSSDSVCICNASSTVASRYFS